ncbi:uncharacterized protein BCR38DRAFT_170274 [Pseudomassariella vexata]|uniref:Uncharacterized protein n=1 Tax=Pseudomassariella vexata TaxID=1141098 RepID=A0A1Y2E3P0_9PEZI|nr:uncharacterized protein BCR38DRAFT_170274 [Pseudomassariella vexata]ORY65964.1 hypothetical protein BCR38DRAFT_170274 [Pseudomassariella vexata]
MNYTLPHHSLLQGVRSQNRKPLTLRSPLCSTLLNDIYMGVKTHAREGWALQETKEGRELILSECWTEKLSTLEYDEPISGSAVNCIASRNTQSSRCEEMIDIKTPAVVTKQALSGADLQGTSSRKRLSESSIQGTTQGTACWLGAQYPLPTILRVDFLSCWSSIPRLGI